MLEMMVVWALFTAGLTYLVTRSEILKTPRLMLVARFEFLAGLFSCDWCSSFWTGMTAFYVLLALTDVGTSRLWWCGPIAGICGIGMTEVLHKLSPGVAVSTLASVIGGGSDERS